MRRISIPWLVAAAAIACLIWANSLVPGTGSSELSLSVLAWVQDALAAIGLDASWLTNLIVRKVAHFTEYALFASVLVKGIDPDRVPDSGSVFLSTAMVLLVPAIDETIQLFVPGRTGQVADVVIDCCGACFGILVTFWIGRALKARKRRRQSEARAK